MAENNSGVRSVRANPEAWARWRAVAEAKGFTLNAWIVRTLGLAADRAEAETARAAAEIQERERLQSSLRGF